MSYVDSQLFRDFASLYRAVEEALEQNVSIYHSAVVVTSPTARAVSQYAIKKMAALRTDGRPLAYPPCPIPLASGCLMHFFYGTPPEGNSISQLMGLASMCAETVPAKLLASPAVPSDLPLLHQYLVRWTSLVYQLAWDDARLATHFSYSLDRPWEKKPIELLPWQNKYAERGFHPRSYVTLTAAPTDHCGPMACRVLRGRGGVSRDLPRWPYRRPPICLADGD